MDNRISQRNLSIDLIKIISMYMVLMLHLHVQRRLCTTFDYSTTPFWYSLAGIAIPLFFMVSGYLMSKKQDIEFKYSIRKIWGIVKFTLLICLIWDIFIYLTTQRIRFDFPICFMKDGGFSHFWYFGSMIIVYSILPVLRKLFTDHLRLVMVSLGAICFIFFLLDCVCLFEKGYVIQTFRVWYWFFYFGLGFCVERKYSYLTNFKMYYLVAFMSLYLLSVYFIKPGGIEYHFGNPFCPLYATAVFLMLLKVQITHKKIIQILSSCFLPIYAFHEIALGYFVYHQPFLSIEQNAPFPFLLEYLIAVFMITTVAVVIMKLPGMKRIFSI